MNKPILNDYINRYGTKNFETQRKAFLKYAKDLERYCSELEKENKDLKYNQLVLKGTLINMQCEDFRREAMEEECYRDDEELEKLIKLYEEIVSTGIDSYLRGIKECIEDPR